METTKPAQRETTPQFGQKNSVESSIQAKNLPVFANAPIIDLNMPYEQAVRSILIFYLEQIQTISGIIQDKVNQDDISLLQYYIRSARRVLNSMGEQLDVTDLSPIPSDLRWLSKCNRPLLEWTELIAQAENYLAISDGNNQGIKYLLQAWKTEQINCCNNLLSHINGLRFERFSKAANRIQQNEKTGIFAKKTTIQKLVYILPSMVWEQYQQLCILEYYVDSPKPKQIRQIARQTRNLYHLLAHMKTVLGDSGARCIVQIYSVEQFFREYDALNLTVARTKELASTLEKPEQITGVIAFLDAKIKERDRHSSKLPQLFTTITSLQFRRDLGEAVIGP